MTRKWKTPSMRQTNYMGNSNTGDLVEETGHIDIEKLKR